LKEVFREMTGDEFYRPRIEDFSAMALKTCVRESRTVVINFHWTSGSPTF